ncbi:MAG: hypothetical protein AB1630_02395 [bacterium]
MKNKVFILALLWSLLAYPYTITNTAQISGANFSTITTNSVYTTHYKRGILSGNIKDVLSNMPIFATLTLNGTSSGGFGTYSIFNYILSDGTTRTFTASNPDYYEKTKITSLSSSTTNLNFSLCPKKRDIPEYTWRMVSFPADPSGNASILGNTLETGDDLGRIDQENWRTYIWDEDAIEDDYLSKYRNPATITSGLGYWFKYYNKGTISLFTQGTPSSATYTIPLKAGWNMIGNPSIFKINKNSIKEQVGTQTFNLGSHTEAVFWGYNEGYNDENSLLPHFGYWIRAISACLLVFPRMEWDDSETKGISLFALNDGYAKIIAKSGDITSNLVFGISPSASDGFDLGIDLSSPPKALDSSLYLCFKGGYIKDIRKDRDDITWDVSILGKNNPIELSFEGISGIDKEYQVFLVDGNNVFDLRKNPGYTLDSPRNLKIRLTKEGLAIQENKIVKIVSYPNPSQGELTFYIALKTKGASFNVTMYNIVGQKVYEGNLLPAPGKSWERFSKEEQAYIYESKFEGKGSHNLPLASGLYIYEIRSYALNSENKACGKLLIKK